MAALAVVAAPPAQANELFLQDAITAEIQSDRSNGCDVSVETAPLGLSRTIGSVDGSLKVVSIQTEGCYGGNNYQNRIVVFNVSGSKAVRVPMRDLGFAWVESMEVSSKAGVPIVKVIAPKYLDSDGRCCPSMLQEIRIWAEQSGVEWKEVRVWKKK